MFLAHSFRLRDPWQCEATEGGVRWSRIFHRPTGLEPDDELWLVISGLPAEAVVAVNGHSFQSGATGILPVPAAGTSITPPTGGSQTPPQAAQYNVTSILHDSNQIEILLSPAPSPHPPAPRFPYDARLGIVARS